MLPDPWLDEDTVTVGLRPSNFPDRTRLLDIILSAVPSPSTSGIVVVGDRGSGKSHLLLSVKAGLPDTMDVRTFAGKPELRTTRYAALGAASAPGDEETLPPGFHVLRALTSTLGAAEYLYTPPAGRRRTRRRAQPSRPPLVLLVDDIHYVDPASLAVLLQLIPGFGATLVATADSRRPLPPDLYQLWEDGFLEQYFLPPFTFNEAHALCEAALGGKVQRRASSLLAAMSGFNVGLLGLAVDDARRAHLLVQKDGFWTIDVRAQCDWPGVVAQVQAENAARPPEERQALELIALAEPVALEVVEHHFGQRAVEDLLANHHIRVLPGRPPLLRTSSWLRGEGTRLSVPMPRSVALRLGVEEPALTVESAPTMLRWMTWTLDCGLTLSDELLLATAPAADRPSTAELALRAAAAVSMPAHQDEARLLRARALIAEGQLTEAAPELRELAVGGSPRVKADATSRLLALELLGAVPRDAVDGPASPDDSRSGAELSKQLVQNIREAERLLLSGAAPEALEVSTVAMAAINADPALEVFRPGAVLRHVMCLRNNLAWGHVDSLLECPSAFVLPTHLALCLEVGRGYAELSQGLPRAARGTLEPVLAELPDAGLPPVLAVAAAMMAYSEALCGNAIRAMERVQQSTAVLAHQDFPPDGLLPQLSALYIAAAQDQVSGKSSHLLELAEHVHTQGHTLLEAEAVSLLTLNPSCAAVDDLVIQRRLAGLAAAVHGAGGAALGTFASALLDNDPKTLESAGRSLSADRQFAHAAICYSRAASGYEAKTRNAASRRAAVLVERLRAAFDSGAVPPLGWVPGRAGG
ncbi:AAA ATPase domain-containing protein [Arthrobacter sp. cf158]|uniref:ATP-binding protein n=1 Tax=Arthrobacter sp. cf158 TaxID=1761744 RepID=UPI0008957A92|nr:ATP-binding protein [Arthrobacter sp. cf158]SDW09721.1 AAA ATPase domain-containing protein [Arthrobacter sp. cf158]